MSAGPSSPALMNAGDPGCVSALEPQAPTGPFASPDVIFRRIVTLTWNPINPVGKPPVTDVAWAGDAVSETLSEAAGHVLPGVEQVLRHVIGVPDDAPMNVAWSQLLSTGEQVVPTLLTFPFEDANKGFRYGIFTEPAWLAERTSISTRGTQIQLRLLGTQVPPPPPGLPQSAPPGAGETERQALEKSLASPACVPCHRMTDGPGFALGHYDAGGLYRDLDNGQPIDTSGTLVSPGVEMPFTGIIDFNKQLAFSCIAARGFADSFLQAAIELNGQPFDQQNAALYDANHERVERAFVYGGMTYEALVKAYIQSPAGLAP